MKKKVFNTLKGERLILKPVSMKYAGDVYREMNDEVTALMYPKPNKNLRETKKVLRRFIRQGKKARDFVYVITKNEEFIGMVGLHNMNIESAELGIWTKLSAHGNKYGREAIAIVSDFAFQTLGIAKLSYKVDKRNTASKKIPLSMGGICIGESECLNMAGSLLLLEEYSIINPNR